VSEINNYSRNREQRQRAARVKRLIYGTFSGIPMLRHVDIAAPTYWINSAALVKFCSIYFCCRRFDGVFLFAVALVDDF